MTWAELRPAFAKWRYPCAERASAHGLIARNNQFKWKADLKEEEMEQFDCKKV